MLFVQTLIGKATHREHPVRCIRIGNHDVRHPSKTFNLNAVCDDCENR